MANNTSKFNFDAVNDIAASVSKTANELNNASSAMTLDDEELGIGKEEDQSAGETTVKEESQEEEQKKAKRASKKNADATGGVDGYFEEKLKGMSPKVANLLREITKKSDKNKGQKDKNYIHISSEVWPYLQKIKKASGTSYEMIVMNMIVHVLRQCQEEVWNLDKDEAKPVL